MGAFNKEGIKIIVGTKEYTVVEQPLSRVKRIQKVWAQIFEKINAIQSKVNETAREALELDPEAAPALSSEEMFDEIFDLVIEQPYEILSVAIPDLDKEDTVEWATFPQILDALDAMLKVNRIEFLKTLTPFLKNMILSIDPTQEMMSASQKIVSMPGSSPAQE